MRSGLATLVGLLLLACAVSGCGGSTPAKKPNSAQISKADLPRGAWPLTVSEGTVRCEGVNAVTFTAPDGTVYGVNGTALTQGLPRIDPIWKKDPDIPGARVSIGPIIDKGLALCK